MVVCPLTTKALFLTGRKRERERERMSLSDWHLAVKLADQPLAPKSILRLPETELGEYSLGGYSISFLKQLIAGKLQESVPDPELIGEPLWTKDGLLL